MDWNLTDEEDKAPFDLALQAFFDLREEYDTEDKVIEEIEEIVEILLRCPRADLGLADPWELFDLLIESCELGKPAMVARLVQVPGLDINGREK